MNLKIDDQHFYFKISKSGLSELLFKQTISQKIILNTQKLFISITPSERLHSLTLNLNIEVLTLSIDSITSLKYLKTLHTLGKSHDRIISFQNQIKTQLQVDLRPK